MIGYWKLPDGKSFVLTRRDDGRADFIETEVGSSLLYQRMVFLRESEKDHWIFETYAYTIGTPRGLVLEVEGQGTMKINGVLAATQLFFPERIGKILIEARPSSQAMIAWHSEIYTPWILPLKAAIGPIVPGIREQHRTADLAARCKTLAELIDGFGEDPKELAAPDSGVATALGA